MIYVLSNFIQSFYEIPKIKRLTFEKNTSKSSEFSMYVYLKHLNSICAAMFRCPESKIRLKNDNLYQQNFYFDREYYLKSEKHILTTMLNIIFFFESSYVLRCHVPSIS